MVTAIAAMQGTRSLRRAQKLSGNRRSRPAIAHFLTKAQWDAPDVLRHSALQTLHQLGWRKGDVVYTVLDDTQKKKRGKRMDAVSKIFLHAEKVYAQGHTILGCALVYRGVVIPYAVRLWACEAFCVETESRPEPEDRLEFRTLTEIGGRVDRTGELDRRLEGDRAVRFTCVRS